MTKIRKITLSLLIAILSVALIVTTAITFSDNIATATGGDTLTATVDTVADDVNHNHTWSHDGNGDAIALEDNGVIESGTSEQPAHYYLSEKVNLTSDITIESGYVELCLNGHTLAGTGNSTVITVNGGANFTLHDCAGNGKVTGGNANGGVYVNGTFTMNGGIITDNTASMGGGVYVYSTFIMNGGAITGNKATYGGGGVLVAGKFVMDGGIISNNTSSDAGGGVYVGNGATFNMITGTIFGNTATSNGGGVFNDGDFTMEGGAVSGNTASGGGGVCVGGTFTMSGGTIGGEDEEANTATNIGGGVFAWGTFVMDGGTISGNTSAYGGGGVFITNTFTMTSGTITDNTSTNGNGGGVNIGDDATFTMTLGTITGNTAVNGSGGGVFVIGDFTITAGTIKGNSATNDGDGVFVSGSLNLSGIVDISGNGTQNLFIQSGKLISITGELKQGNSKSNIYITLEDGNGAFATASKDVCEYFTPDVDGKCIGYHDGNLVLADHNVQWIQSEDGHYKQCANCGETSDNGTHDWSSLPYEDDGNGSTHHQECDECGYVKTERHYAVQDSNYTDDGNHDATEHWKLCVCGAHVDNQTHEVTYATSWDNDGHTGTCDICQAEVTVQHNLQGIDYKNDGDSNLDEHWLVCTVCEQKVDAATHEWNGQWLQGDVNHYQECDICGQRKTQNHTLTWANDEEYHWEKCDTCGYNESGNEAKDEHDWSDWQSAGSEGHERTCTDECGVAKQTAVHRYSGNYVNDTDKGQHYQVCDEDSCGYKNYEEHSWGGWTTTVNGDSETARQQIRTCDDCETEDTRELVLDSIETVSVQEEYYARETELKLLKIKAHYNYNGEEVEAVEVEIGTYAIEKYAKGEYLTVHDESIEVSYTIGGVTVTTNASITVKPLSVTTEGYAREDWHESKTASKETLPTNILEAKYEYYMGAERTNKYEGKFDESTPAGTYYVWLIVDNEDYEHIEQQVGSFTVTAHNFSGDYFHDNDGSQHYQECQEEDCNVCEYNSHIWEWAHDSDNHWQYCTDCNYNEDGEVTNAAHEYTWSESEDKSKHNGTCTEVGCGNTTSHNINVETWESDGEENHKGTCTEEGCNTEVVRAHSLIWAHNAEKHWKECERCEYTEEETKATEHSWSEWRLKGETEHERNCTDNCGVESETHNPSGSWKEWDVTGSSHTRTCGAGNGCELKDEHAEAWGAWEDKEGTHERECTTCKEKQSHEAEKWETVTQLESNKANHQLTCTTVDGCTVTREEVHSWGEGWSKNAENSKHERVCEKCKLKDEHDANDWSEWGTYEESGKHARSCQVSECTLTEEHAAQWSNWSKKDNSTHQATCTDTTNGECSITKEESHSWSAWSSKSETEHARRCTEDCGVDEQTASHSYGDTYVNDNGRGQHYQTCTEETCDYKAYSDHKYSWTESEDKIKHNGTCTAAECGATTEHEIKVKTWVSDGEENHKGTCTEEGCNTEVVRAHSLIWAHNAEKHWKECEACGYSEKDTDKVAVHRVTEAVTAGTSGHTGQCVDCKQTVTVAHTTLGDYTTEGNHDQDGHWLTCSVCQDKLDEEAHDWSKIQYVADEGGETHHQQCPDCNVVKTEVHVITDFTNYDENGHSGNCIYCGAQGVTAPHVWNDGEVTEEASCTSTGVKTYTCTVCSQTKEEDIEKTPHTSDNVWHYDADSHWNECTTCDEQLNKSAHELVWKHSDTEHWQECSDDACGYVSVHTLHSYNETYTNDADEGKHYQTCTEEGCSYKNYSDHSWGSWSSKDSSHHERSCVDGCDAKTTADHTVATRTTREPTCTADGEAINYCTVCDAELGTEDISKLEHEWDDGKVTQEAKPFEKGQNTYTCKKCGEEKTEEIPAKFPWILLLLVIVAVVEIGILIRQLVKDKSKKSDEAVVDEGGNE